MAFFEEAKREAVPLMVGIAGPSGSGKTFSALLVAAGLAGPSGRVGLIDTELGRGSMYADDPEIIAAMPGGRYFRHEMTEPFTPEKYGAAIKNAAAEGITALVIDSATHEWEGLGGCQDIAEKNKLRGLPNWALAKLHHKRLMNQATQAPLHIIFCLRARPKTKPEKNDKGEIVMVELGMQAIQEKNFMYEMTVSMMLDEGTNLPTITKCPKPLRPLFAGDPKLLTKSVGEALRAWSEGGAALDKDLRSLKQRCRDAAMSGNAALDAFFKGLSRADKELIKTAGEDFKVEARALAAEADQVAADQIAAERPFKPANHPIPALDPEIVEEIERGNNSREDAFTAGANVTPPAKEATAERLGAKARQIVDDTHSALEADAASQNHGADSAPPSAEASPNPQPHANMKPIDLKKATMTAVAAMESVAQHDIERRRATWADFDGAALIAALGNAGLRTEKLRLEAVAPPPF